MNGGGTLVGVDGFVIEEAETHGPSGPEASVEQSSAAQSCSTRLEYGLMEGALVWVLIAAQGPSASPGREEIWCRVRGTDRATGELRVTTLNDCTVLPWRAGHQLKFGRSCVRDVLTQSDWLACAESLAGAHDRGWG